MIVPEDGAAHVGGVEVAVTTGAVGGELIVTEIVVTQTPATLLVTDIVYEPTPTPLKIGDD